MDWWLKKCNLKFPVLTSLGLSTLKKNKKQKTLKWNGLDEPADSMPGDQNILLFNSSKLIDLFPYCIHFYHSGTKSMSLFGLVEISVDVFS